MKFRPFTLIRSRSALSFTSSTSCNSFISYSFRTLCALGPPQSSDNPFSFLLLRTLHQNTGEWPVSPCGKVANPAVSSALSSLQFRVSARPLPVALLSTVDYRLSTFDLQLSTLDFSVGLSRQTLWNVQIRRRSPATPLE